MSGRSDAGGKEPTDGRTHPNPLAALTDEQLIAFAAARLVGVGAREADLVRLFRALSAADQDRVLELARAVSGQGGSADSASVEGREAVPP